MTKHAPDRSLPAPPYAAPPYARRRKRALCLVLAGLGAALLSACGSSSKAASQTTTTKRASATTTTQLPTISAGTLKAATQTDEFPFAFVKNGQVTGFVVDLVDDVASKLHLHVQYKTIAFSGLLSAIANHQYDIGAIGVLDTPARSELVAFSEPIYYGSFGALARKSEHLGNLQALSSATVGAVLGTAEAAYVQKHDPKANLKTFPSETAAVGALEAHQVQAVLIGGPDVHAYLAEHSNLEALGYVPLSTPNALPMNKSDGTLVKAVNQELNVLFDNGTYAKLYHKWFPGTPIPSELVSQHPQLGSSSSSS